MHILGTVAITAASVGAAGTGTYLAMDRRRDNDLASIGLGIGATVGIGAGYGLAIAQLQPSRGAAAALLGGTLAAVMGANYLGWRLATAD